MPRLRPWSLYERCVMAAAVVAISCVIGYGLWVHFA